MILLRFSHVATEKAYTQANGFFRKNKFRYLITFKFIARGLYSLVDYAKFTENVPTLL